MLQSLTSYVYDRRKGLAKTAGIIGGVYLIGRYVLDRLEEVKDRVMQERLAKDNLRRRFQQAQQDISYTIMALLPSLAEQILDEMDVESLTNQLQLQAKSRRPRSPPQSQGLVESESSLASSIDVIHEQDARSESASVVSADESASTSSRNRWVHDRFSSDEMASSAHRERDPSPSQYLSDSMTTTSSAFSQSQPSDGHSSDSYASSTRTKAELWKEVKILTFTRALTVLYTSTLLSILTTVQLSLLARRRYVRSVLQLSLSLPSASSSTAPFPSFPSFSSSPFDLELDIDSGTSSNKGKEKYVEEEVEEDVGEWVISEETEATYLTLSWWLLHVGWKDVGERVRRGVEDVFEGVSLKTKLGPKDVHRLVHDVRRRVEHGGALEPGHESLGTSFLSALLPPTPETLQHTLSAGGSAPAPSASSIFPSFPTAAAPSTSDRNAIERNTQVREPFTALLDETRSILSSPDFARVREVALDRAAGVLIEGLKGGGGVFNSRVGSSYGTEKDAEEGTEAEERIRLAGLLPGLARWSRLALVGMPNELVDSVLSTRETAGLSAIVFAGFEDRFL